ncbi:SHOCT domain-containing protein [Gordonia sp. DT30]|uniref:SHOCT domain-containing protein n=1 Tax=Gordonia sp. DT30 TaxID=3416546 RepID=UPI003CE8E56A
MPGLLRGVARTAAVAGTATAVSNRVSRRQGRRWAAQSYEEQQPPPAQYAAPAPQYAPAPAPAPTSNSDRIAELQQLAELHAQGVLTDDEFAAEKQRILSS